MAAEEEEAAEARVVIRGNGRRRRRSSLRVEIADAENTLFVVFPIRFAADSEPPFLRYPPDCRLPSSLGCLLLPAKPRSLALPLALTSFICGYSFVCMIVLASLAHSLPRPTSRSQSGALNHIYDPFGSTQSRHLSRTPRTNC